MARSIHCECTYHFTCGYCLRNAPPPVWTFSTWQEIIHRQIYDVSRNSNRSAARQERSLSIRGCN